MAGTNHNYDFLLPFLDQSQFAFDPSIPTFDTLPYIDPYQPLPSLTATVYDNLHDWDGVLHNEPIEGLGQWHDTPTVTNGSSVSTPLPSNDHDDSDESLSRQRSAESKRSGEEFDDGQSHKRQRSDGGQNHTAKNRLTGACLCCQMRTNKHACSPGPDPSGPCRACFKKATLLSPVTCRRARFQDVELFRLGPSRDFAMTLRWLRKETTSLSDPQKALWKPIENLPRKKAPTPPTGYKTVRLSQGYNDQTLDLRVQEFDPTKDDKQHYIWFEDDVEHEYRCPPYAIADRDHAKEEIRHFINNNMSEYIDHLLPESEAISAAYPRMVFQTALHRAQESSLVELALRFWVAGRFIESPWTISGSETLGMKPDASPSSPYFNKIPVTPIMDFQIDNIVIHEHLKKLLQDIRKSMRHKIMPIKKEDWFDIHLTSFILLHHVDLTMRHDMEFAKQHNLSHKRFSNKPLIDMITFGANTLLEYFHHEKGHFPLSATSWSDVESSYTFCGPQKAYLLSARKMVRQINTPPLAGDDLFWVSQLHTKEWQPAVVLVA